MDNSKSKRLERAMEVIMVIVLFYALFMIVLASG
jgi:hypothetical protein